MLSLTRKDSDLREQVTILQTEVARLSRELAELRAQARNGTVRVERSGCALIADRLGINERTVRGTLTSHAKFAHVREACAKRGSVITRDREFLGWLADHLEAYPR